MICEIEQALAAYVTAAFAAATPPVLATILAAMSEATKPTAQTIVIVKCANAAHVVGGLVDAEINLTVESPAGVQGVTLASHIAIERALRSAFPADNSSVPAGLATAVAAGLPGYTCCGHFYKGQQPGIERTQWVPYYELTIGLDPAED